jgi:transposase
MKSRHSTAFKESIIKKICLPGGPTIMQISKELGIHHVTIRNWMKIYANISIMKDSNDWTPERKLEAIIKTASMNENELGEFLRANGLHSKAIEEWKHDIYIAQRPVGRPKLDPELVELRAKEKELSRDLKRKDKALAEMSARIILLKKSNLFFGGTEDDE